MTAIIPPDIPTAVCALLASTGDSSPVVTGLTSPARFSFAEESSVLALDVVLPKASFTVDAGPVV